MRKLEWFRETVSELPTEQMLVERQAKGWRPVAIEWEREVEYQVPTADAPSGYRAGEIPYGLRIAADCRHLEENPAEMDVLRFLAEMVVQDLSFPRMADMLNLRGLRTRDGRPWTAVDVFQLTPRLIDATPRILSTSEWVERKKQLSHVPWNS
jgi:hypothetical protein